MVVLGNENSTATRLFFFSSSSGVGVSVETEYTKQSIDRCYDGGWDLS